MIWICDDDDDDDVTETRARRHRDNAPWEEPDHSSGVDDDNIYG